MLTAAKSNITPSQRQFMDNHKEVRKRFHDAARRHYETTDEFLAKQAERRKKLEAEQEIKAEIERQVKKALELEMAKRVIRQAKRDEIAFLKMDSENFDGALTAINKCVAAYYGVTLDALKSPMRTAHVMRPRQVAYYIGRRIAMKSWPQISRQLGFRDHTSSMSGERKIAKLLLTDAELRSEVSALIQIIEGV